ncbi:MAG TPA: MFS transporter [Acidimicrobiia bacterium]
MRSIGQRFSFATVLASTMGAATFSLVVYSVLAAELIEEFGVDRWQIGALVTANSLFGAIVSPFVGVFTDRIGARRATILTLIVSAVALSGTALSPVYPLLIVVALVGGVAQALTNPATNKLISLHIDAGRRGVITGIKQSGVQFGTFLAGVILPPVAIAYGWRAAVGVFVAMAVSAVVLAMVTLPADPHHDEARHGPSTPGPLPGLIYRLAVYGFLLGSAGTAIFTYLPLFAEEQLGFPAEVAGLSVSVTGLVGIVARISWGRIAEQRFGSARSLALIAVLAVTAALTLAGAGRVPAAVWIGAVLTGASASSWNTVGMLAIIQNVPASRAGRGSGIVLLGFLAGLATGAPLFGWSVDVLGTYTPGWLVVGGVFAAAVGVIWPLVPRRRAGRATV